jgi:hypothetical protein
MGSRRKTMQEQENRCIGASGERLTVEDIDAVDINAAVSGYGYHIHELTCLLSVIMH